MGGGGKWRRNRLWMVGDLKVRTKRDKTDGLCVRVGGEGRDGDHSNLIYLTTSIHWYIITYQMTFGLPTTRDKMETDL